MDRITEQDLADLIERHAEANSAWMVGDARSFLDLLPLADDVTLMTAFGGAPSRSFDASPERMERLRHFFRNGTLEVETIATYTAGDLAVLALVERSEAEVGGLPRQTWALRVTMVYRREADGWRLVLRHADPLRGGIEVKEAAELARR
jgi:ketosteroid isomerase-like protein